MFVYLLTNNVTEKYYVGKTVKSNLGKYLRDKTWRAETGRFDNMPIIKSIAKHGWESFTVDVLAEPQTKEVLNEVERLWIALLNSRDPQVGYNVARGGEGAAHPHTAEHNQKIGLANKGRKPKGYARTEEHRQQLRDRMQGNQLGRKFSPGTAAHYILNETPEQKIKRSESLKAAWARRKLLKGEHFAASR